MPFCSECNKEYKHEQSLSRHLLSAHNIRRRRGRKKKELPKEDVVIEEEFKEVIEEEFKEDVKEDEKVIVDNNEPVEVDFEEVIQDEPVEEKQNMIENMKEKFFDLNPFKEKPEVDKIKLEEVKKTNKHIANKKPVVNKNVKLPSGYDRERYIRQMLKLVNNNKELRNPEKYIDNALFNKLSNMTDLEIITFRTKLIAAIENSSSMSGFENTLSTRVLSTGIGILSPFFVTPGNRKVFVDEVVSGIKSDRKLKMQIDMELENSLFGKYENTRIGILQNILVEMTNVASRYGDPFSQGFNMVRQTGSNLYGYLFGGNKQEIKKLSTKEDVKNNKTREKIKSVNEKIEEKRRLNQKNVYIKPVNVDNKQINVDKKPENVYKKPENVDNNVYNKQTMGKNVVNSVDNGGVSIENKHNVDLSNDDTVYIDF
jgi:uncharacterized C2H2 Zn-finger protein